MLKALALIAAILASWAGVAALLWALSAHPLALALTAAVVGVVAMAALGGTGRPPRRPTT